MHVAQDGQPYTGMLPTDGDYNVRVYLMRSAARRNEVSNYELTISVTGHALAPLPASKDALVPGTPFHASASITCLPMPYGDTKPQQCEAFVIRRGADGTATVEIPSKGIKRRILFVKGSLSASDSSEKMTATRKGDVTTMKFESGEYYEIVDALVIADDRHDDSLRRPMLVRPDYSSRPVCPLRCSPDAAIPPRRPPPRAKRRRRHPRRPPASRPRRPRQRHRWQARRGGLVEIQVDGRCDRLNARCRSLAVHDALECGRLGRPSPQLQLGRGTWSAEAATDPSSGRFEFGPLAATMASCPPPGVDEQVTRQAPYVRSYLLKDGRLYLSLMADGGIFVWERSASADSPSAR